MSQQEENLFQANDDTGICINNKVPNSQYIKFMYNIWPFALNSKSLGKAFVETFSELRLTKKEKTELLGADYLNALSIISNNYIDFSS